ncbi:MAG: TlpA family protein disulfide reductase [Candidatus Hydrogenedens sp.]|jgi:thiol-disulfide isomerase/thioredoxin|nr:TlpA family protein disulfide reductase [Candidatus Hydrogenedens sp.]
MRTFFPGTAGLIILLLLASAQISALQLGDEAPALSIDQWIQGSAVDLKVNDDTLYIIEFWATWCPPCRMSIPELNSLQEKYASKKVTIVGITQEEVNTVEDFLKEQPMHYTLARDKESLTWKAYAESSGVNGIPYAFIVKNGRLWWLGSPFDDMEAVIKRILSDGYSLEDARNEVQHAQIREEMAQLLELWMQEYLVYANFGRDKDSADALGQRILARGQDFPEMLGILAWHIAVNDSLRYRNLDYAQLLSEKACALTDNKDPDLLDTQSHVLFARGKKEEALALLKKALLLSDNEEITEMLQESLHMMQEHD